MTQITEDYVSFETAKLLKEKGFDETCRAFWKDWNSELCLCSCGNCHVFEFCHNSMLENYNDEEETNIAAPTLQMAMKWLRKVHNLHIEIIWYQLPLGYAPNIVNIKEHKTVASIRNKNKEWDEPEEAADTAIKYCLKNLI